MTLEIKRIHLPFPFNVSQLYCYLLKSEAGFYLIDTGYSNSREKLITELDGFGCIAGNLKLIILTHGDFDHIGNAVYLQQQFGAKIVMHLKDTGMLERGEIFWNRVVEGKIVKGFLRRLVLTKKEDLGKPDIIVDDDASLAAYGLEAMVFNTPGHSSGSISIFTPAGDLFCGDLIINSTGKPRLNHLLFNQPAAKSSLEKLKTLPIKTVYPGHGAPFSWVEFMNRV